MSKVKFKIVGKTSQGITILNGGDVFRFVETYGLPLAMVCEKLKERNFMPSWFQYKKRGLKVGWNLETIKRTIEEAIVENYGEGSWNVIKKKLFKEEVCL